MTFATAEWARLVGYLTILVACAFLAHRYGAKRKWPLAALCGSTGLFSIWLAFDLTLVSIGLSTRETRGYGTVFVILLAGAAVALAATEIGQMRYERQLYREIDEIAERMKSAEGMEAEAK